MSWYLLVHLFVNIVSQLNLMRQYIVDWIRKIILYYKLNRIWELLSMHSTIFSLFFKSLGLEKVIELTPRNFKFFLDQISSDLGDKSYMNFGFNIQYHNTCNQCKSTKLSSESKQLITFQNLRCSSSIRNTRQTRN